MSAPALLKNLPAVSIAQAPLPQTYKAACTALAECNSIDECKGWADKAAALASYARQSDDDTLHKLADRIRSRAVRRCGELMEHFHSDPKANLRNGNARGAGPGPSGTQRAAADGAGLSKRQEKQARSVARIPQAEFDALVESDRPPTVTELARLGTRAQPTPHPRPKNFYAATHTVAAMRRLWEEFCTKYNPEDVADGLDDEEVDDVRKLVDNLDHWLDRFVVNLPHGARK